MIPSINHNLQPRWDSRLIALPTVANPSLLSQPLGVSPNSPPPNGTPPSTSLPSALENGASGREGAEESLIPLWLKKQFVP